MKKKSLKYAALRISGKQYLASEGDEILVEGFDLKDIKIEVLLFVEGEKVQIGRPLLDKINVKYKVLEEIKGEKVDVVKYKSKSRYRRHMGFRPQYTKILIEKISF